MSKVDFDYDEHNKYDPTGKTVVAMKYIPESEGRHLISAYPVPMYTTRTNPAQYKIALSDGEDIHWIETNSETYNKNTIGKIYNL